MSLKGESAGGNKTALVTRIQGAKFKNITKPGDHLMITVDGKTIMTIEFAATLVDGGVI